MLRASTAFTTKGQLKRRWMILNHEDGTLSCHDGPFSIDVSKGVLEIWKVNEILEDTTSYQEGNVYRLLGGVGNWTVCLIGDAPYAWRRRLMQHIRLA